MYRYAIEYSTPNSSGNTFLVAASEKQARDLFAASFGTRCNIDTVTAQGEMDQKTFRIMGFGEVGEANMLWSISNPGEKDWR